MGHVATVTIDSGEVDSDLTDFVVYVDLSDLPATFWDTVANGGGDIRCYKSDGTTQLEREVVSCDTATDTGELYVRFSGTLSSSVDTEIQIHADGVSSDYAVTATYGRNNVWQDYVAVLHMETDDTDSTGNWTPTDSGVTYQGGGALSGGGYAAFNSSNNDSIFIGPSTDIVDEPHTLQAWAKMGSLNQTRIVSAGDENSANRQRGMGTDTNNTVSQDLSIYAQSDSGITTTETNTAVDQSQWRKYDAVFTDFDDRTLFFEGSSVVSSTVGRGATVDRIAVGVSADLTPFGNQPLDIDEARVINGALSTAWLAAEYSNQATPTTFYSVTAIGGATVDPYYYRTLMARGQI